MFYLNKHQEDGCIVYDFIGEAKKDDMKDVYTSLKQDISKTYAFIFNFKKLTHIDIPAVKELKHVYVLGLNSACDMVICELNNQPKLMVEVLNTNSLFVKARSLRLALDIFEGEDNDSFYSNY